MKLLFDQNLSHKLATDLAVDFPGSAHVRDFGMARTPDPANQILKFVFNEPR